VHKPTLKTIFSNKKRLPLLRQPRKITSKSENTPPEKLNLGPAEVKKTFPKTRTSFQVKSNQVYNIV
jgi:hypothetical protein